MKKATVNVRINEDLKERIVEESTKRDINISNFIIEAINDKLNKNNYNLLMPYDLVKIVNIINECDEEDKFNELSKLLIEIEKTTVYIYENIRKQKRGDNI